MVAIGKKTPDEILLAATDEFQAHMMKTIRLLRDTQHIPVQEAMAMASMSLLSPIMACVCASVDGREDADPIVRRRLSFALRRPTDRHIVYLPKDSEGKPRACWTLVFTGPRIREWGFWYPKGFVHWKRFVDTSDHGNVGRGCE